MNEKEIDVFIPCRNRDLTRIRRCIKSIRDNNLGLVGDIFLLDYSSDTFFKPEDIKFDTKYITIKNKKEWNKCHCLNLGIKLSQSKYIMTVDCDMLLDKSHFESISQNLNENNLIIDTNVRRVTLKDYSKDYSDMIDKSLPWREENRNQLFNSANGGIQLYSRNFYNKINGLSESMGFYSGGMDNWVYFIARQNGLNIVDLSIPLLHQEHPKQKEANFNKEEQEFALVYRQFKANYLDDLIFRKATKNEDEFYGRKEPFKELLNEIKYEFENRNKLIQEAINSKKTEVTLYGQRFKLEKAKPNILICVINNYGLLPDFFVWDLFKLFMKTKNVFPEVDIQQINACDVNSMRNLSIKLALGDNQDKKKYDYVVCLDDDHRYPEEFLIKFINLMEENKWPILTGLTSSKAKPYRNTQYHQFLTPINTDENCVRCDNPKEEVIQIEASGPVGMVINTKIFDKLEFPYYYVEYGKKEVDGVEKDTILGGDLVFSKKLLEKKIPIRLDLNTTFPHSKSIYLNRGKLIDV